MALDLFLLVYALVVLPYLGSLYDLLVLINPAILQAVGLAFKDGLLLILLLLVGYRYRFSLFTKSRLLVTTMGFCFLSYFWRTGPAAEGVFFAGVRNYCIYPMAFFVAYHAGRQHLGRQQRIVGLALVAVLVNAFMGFLQAAGILPSLYAGWMGKTFADQNWAHGAFLSYIEYAFFLTVAVSLLTVRLKGVPGERRDDRSTILLVAVTGAAILLSESRTGLLIWLLALGGLVLASRSRPLRLLFIASALVGVLLVVQGSALGGHRAFQGSVGDDPRFTLVLPFALQSFLARPWFGAGLGSFGAASAPGGTGATVGLEYLDSTFLSVILQFGLVGAILYFLTLFSMFLWVDRQAVRQHRFPLRIANLCFMGAAILYSAFFNFADGWPGAIFTFGWFGYHRGALETRPGVPEEAGNLNLGCSGRPGRSA